MKRTRRFFVVMVVAALTGFGLNAHAAAWTDQMLGKDLDSLVAKQLGLTGDQSKGGIGAMLGLAKEKLKAVDYDKIAKVVPGAESYVSKAKKLGLLDKPIESKSNLAAAFTKLGIPKDKAEQLVPTVTTMIGNVGGDEVRKLLSEVL